MGIRVSKEIGYFIPLAKFKDIIVKNYSNVLEKIDYEEEKYLKKMLKGYQNYKSQSKKSHEETFIHIMGKRYEKDNEQIKPYELVKMAMFYDDEIGILVMTPELAKERRYDDLMDYYENYQNNMEGSIRYLNCSIYPSQGYVYTGGLDHVADQNGDPRLEKGQVVGMYEVKSYLPESENIPEEKLQEFVTHSGHFRPNIEAGAYIIAKAFGILQKHVTEDDFNNVFEPVIITSWG